MFSDCAIQPIPFISALLSLNAASSSPSDIQKIRGHKQAVLIIASKLCSKSDPVVEIVAQRRAALGLKSQSNLNRAIRLMTSALPQQPADSQRDELFTSSDRSINGQSTPLICVLFASIAAIFLERSVT